MMRTNSDLANKKMGTLVQATLKSPISFTGVGLHSGQPVRMTLHPASAEFGIWFRRTDVTDRDALIAAKWHAVSESELCTRISNSDGVSVATVEHVMAAIAGCGIHNVLIEIDGPEVPILDGSAAEFVSAILARGLRRSDAPVRAIEILEAVEVRRGDAWARLDPGATLSIDFHIDFADAAIGVQDKSLNMANGTFVHELCDSRTFCRSIDVDAMRARGLALGGTYENAVVVDGSKFCRPVVCATRTSPCATRCLTRLVIWLWLVRRSWVDTPATAPVTR